MSSIFGLGYNNFSFSTTATESSSNDILGINYGDYASLRNGSYHKLLSAYYKQVEEEDSSSSASGSKDTKQALTSISDSATALKDSAAAVKSLFQTETDENGVRSVDYNEDEMYKAVKDFVDNYNSTISATANSDTTNILKAANNLVSYTSKNKNMLSDIGITVGSDNKLSIDEDKFKEASKAKVQSVFQSTGGYAYQVSAKASQISINASNAAQKLDKSTSSTSKSNQSFLKSIATSSDSTKTLGTIQEAAEKAKKSLAVLLESGTNSKFNKVTQTDENGKTSLDYDRDAIYSAVNDFISDYNTLIGKAADSNTQTISQAGKTLSNYALANKSALSALGITIDSNNKLSMDKDTFMDADMSKVKSLFQDTNSFGKLALQQITKAETYAKTEAVKANTYTNTGTYSSNLNSGDWYSSFI